MYIEMENLGGGNNTLAMRLVVSAEDAVDLTRYDLDKRVIVTGADGVVRVRDLLEEPVAVSAFGWLSSVGRLEHYVRHALRLVADDLAIARREERAMAALMRRGRLTLTAHAA